MFSKKATKIDEIFNVDLTLCSKVEIFLEQRRCFSSSSQSIFRAALISSELSDLSKVIVNKSCGELSLQCFNPNWHDL